MLWDVQQQKIGLKKLDTKKKAWMLLKKIEN